MVVVCTSCASNDYSFGQNIASSSRITPHPLFGTSNPFGASTGASGFAEQRSSPFQSTSPQFGGSTFSFQNQGNALQQSNSNFSPSTVSLPSSPFSFGTATDNSNRAPLNSASGVSSTTFGFLSNSGIGFKSTQSVSHSNSAHGSTSSIFGVSNKPIFAPGSASTGFSTSIFGLPSASAFQGSSTSPFQASTTQVFGIRSTTSLLSTSAANLSSSSGPKSTFAPSTSNFSNSNILGIHLNSTSASGSQEAKTSRSAVENKCRGSAVASYSATEVDDGGYSVQIQSISGMGIYKDKSHEELRSEDYELCNKGGHTTCGGQSSSPFCFKTSDTSPANISNLSPLQNHSSDNSALHTFNSNQYPSQSQAIIPHANVASSMTTRTPNLNSSSTFPLRGESIFSMPGSRPFVSTFSSRKRSSTVHVTQPEQIADKVDSISTNNLSQPSLGKDCEDKTRSLSLQFNKIHSGVVVTNDRSIQEKDLSATEKCHQDDVDAVVIEIREPDVLSLMPKVPDDYYTEPSIEELAAMERAEPGFCSRVKDFVVGRKGYGRVKFVGEKDVRHLDLGYMIQFYKKKKVTVYADDTKNHPVQS